MAELCHSNSLLNGATISGEVEVGWRPGRVYISGFLYGTAVWTPDQAVELARLLLTAADSASKLGSDGAMEFPTIMDNELILGTPCKARWVVNIKGGAEKRHFEISVLRDDNDFGKSSYGWFGPSKLLVTHNGGPCDWPLTRKVWDKQLVLARAVADELNMEEGATPETPCAGKQSDCQHERIHREGSLGWFCSKCGAPVENEEDYLNG